jgi:pyrimidine-nucleoside phosphorylase
MRAVDIIVKKRDGGELSPEEIRFVVQGITAGEIPDYQISAWAMAVLWRGMTLRETTDLTLALADSGEQLNLSEIAPNTVDKHSTGGVGDKTTLVVGPIAAACGIPVVKMSGRGLGASGGTIDKLESIPGFRTALSREEILDRARAVGLVICSQTAELAPADGRLYALRDVTGTVPSPALIAASVMSKKIAAGAQAIVLDVKAGPGAFMPTVAEAEDLARWMVRIGRRAGRRMSALVSGMFQPLGCAVGNALEVCEAVCTLRGGGPEDFREHCLTVAAHMLRLGGRATGLNAARAIAEESIRSGAALAKFKALLASQGGDEEVCENPAVLPSAPCRGTLCAPQSGYLAKADAGIIGAASIRLGAGRAAKGDAIDPSVGFLVRVKVGDKIQKGDALCEIHASSPESLADAREEIHPAFVIRRSRVEPLPLFYRTVTG